MMNKVRVWKEKKMIPTYKVGNPEKNPVFSEKRVYQGSSGSVYPHPVIERIFDKKEEKAYLAVYLENDFVKIMVLPEIGGRVQMAYDKTKQRHFIYYNRVIKPALVGLAGPWISGGIEFNWPQHHRPSTFDPVDFTIEEHEDGSATIWCSELERMFRTKGMAGFTLFPDKSYLEVRVKLYNRTPFPQTFLWWANPAVKANDHYQSVFPPDVNAVVDHGKRDVSSFPIAKGTYYKVDYSPGTDISRYKNIPVPTSYMAFASKYDFIGGFEHDSKGGIIHVANHHLSPGKKQWTWGNGDFGHAWDRNLTDEDGPYVELMCGVYTDNQPDFSWMMPNEEREFVQYFMPYRDLGMVKNATKDALVNLVVEKDKVTVMAYTSGIYPDCSIVVSGGEEILLKGTFDASPEKSYQEDFDLPAGIAPESLKVIVSDQNGRELVSWQWEAPVDDKIPKPASPAKTPEDIESNEQLFLTGQHIEQYRHATYNPLDYYSEALRRDPKDARCNNALGLWLLKRGKFKEAEYYFRKALDTLTERNPNPYDGEPYFNLGMSLKYQNKTDEAYRAFYKATWNAAWQNPAFFHLAQIDVARGNWNVALGHINKSLSRNTLDHKALHLKVCVLRKSGRKTEALDLAGDVLKSDMFNFGALYERFLLSEKPEIQEQFHFLIRKNIHNYIEYALDYAAAGLHEEAIKLLQSGIENSVGTSPLAHYYLGWFLLDTGKISEVKQKFLDGSSADPDYCFPNQLESVIALKKAVEINPSDARACYYLGNFWYHARQYDDAISCWERSVKLDGTFPTAFRNLSLGYFNKQGEKQKSLECLEKAFALDQQDARILMELDQLYKRLNRDVRFRLKFLEDHQEVVEQRDDVSLEKITLFNLLGQHEKAYELLIKRKFHPWEGGEGKVTGQYVIALVEMAKSQITEGNSQKAIELLRKAGTYPDNLGEGKHIVARENNVHYWMGIALKNLNRKQEAKRYWLKASGGSSEPSAAMFYNDQQPDQIFYQGLALASLGKKDEAKDRFEKLIRYGEKHLNDHIRIDYFAVSLPDLTLWEYDFVARNRVHCKYMMALGLSGIGKKNEAEQVFYEIIELDKSHLGAAIHKKIGRMSSNPA